MINAVTGRNHLIDKNKSHEQLYQKDVPNYSKKEYSLFLRNTLS